MLGTPQRNLVAFAMLFFAACSAVDAQSETAKPMRFKLDDYGWQSLPKPQPGERPGSHGPLVAIDHKGRILVGFAAHENAGLATREHPGLSFHILRFSPGGKLDRTLLVPTKQYYGNGLYLGPKDQIFAHANDTFQMPSEQNGDGTSSAEWRSLIPCPVTCAITQSPSRQTLIIRESKDGLGNGTVWATNESTYTIIDTSSELPLLRTCTKMAFYGEKITDKFAYWPDYDRDDDRTVRFPFCGVDNYQELPLTHVGAFFPLSDDAFLLLGSDKDRRGVVKLVGQDGQIRFQHTMSEKNEVPQYYVGFWATSDERGDRFAFTVDTWRGGSRFFDISGKLFARRIVVYDEKGRELASVPVSTAYHRDFDFSLSPDGHRLAILDEGVVTVVDMQ